MIVVHFFNGEKREKGDREEREDEGVFLFFNYYFFNQ